MYPTQFPGANGGQLGSKNKGLLPPLVRYQQRPNGQTNLELYPHLPVARGYLHLSSTEYQGSQLTQKA
jgi:hypothetical protein